MWGVSVALLTCALIFSQGSSGSDAGIRASRWMPAGPSPTATVWAVGDGADADGKGRSVARMLQRRRLQRLLYLGDVYEAGTARDYARSYKPIFGRFAPRTAPTPGNHEWPNRRTGYLRYWWSVRGSVPPPFYAFSIGGWQLLSLNSEADHGPGSPQLRWLRRKIEHTPIFGTCRLAFWHRPRFSAAGHLPSPDLAPFWRVLRGSARLVLNGHSHNYQRFLPRHRITEVVAGTGGRTIYREPLPAHRPGLATARFRYGALRLRLQRGFAELDFIAVGGRTLDQDGVRCARGDRAAKALILSTRSARQR